MQDGCFIPKYVLQSESLSDMLSNKKILGVGFRPFNLSQKQLETNNYIFIAFFRIGGIMALLPLRGQIKPLENQLIT